MGSRWKSRRLYAAIHHRITSVSGSVVRSQKGTIGQTVEGDDMKYEYDTVLREIPENGGAYVIFPWDIRQEFRKGRVKVHAEFDGIPYNGSIVNMGLKNEDGSVCYVIGVLTAIRKELGKIDGDMIHVRIEERT